MFSHQYLGMYLTVAALIVLGVLLSAGLWVQQRRDASQHRVTGQQPRWAMAPEYLHINGTTRSIPSAVPRPRQRIGWRRRVGA
jgi:hypothetical protein